MSEYIYPTTVNANAAAENYRANHMNLSLPRNTWWHNYPFSKDMKIVITWGKDSYFFAYARWNDSVFFSDVDDFGWGEGQIKPYKAWIFLYHPDPPLWETIYDADSPLWSEDSFRQQRTAIKAMP
jgi:hypothetical protein